MKSYLEPYAMAEHFGPLGRLTPTGEIPLEPTYTAEAAKNWLESEQHDVFVKDQAYSIVGQFQYIPDGYKHSFLIRRPEFVYKSFYRGFQHMREEAENNFLSYIPKWTNIVKGIHDLLEYVEKSSDDFCIIDSDDILANPAVMIRKYCDTMGLSYHSGLLEWSQGIPDTWHVAKVCLNEDYHWYEKAIMSTGWNKGIKHSGTNDVCLPQSVIDLIEEEMPYYDKLVAHPKRIRIGDCSISS